MNKFLTKSKYKLGLECPNKLFFANKSDEYANQKNNNPFLKALASGGFQVEELARMHYPKGFLIKDPKDHKEYDHKKLVAQTSELLKRENVVIFEAAFLYDNLFVRTDILEKNGSNIRLIEVKAKSITGKTAANFLNKSKKIDSKWKPYLFDVAFQKYVIEKSHPEFEVTPYLMLADKSKSTTINALNQIFRVTKNADDRTGIKIFTKSVLNDISKQSVLSEINVLELIKRIESNEEKIITTMDFEESIKLLSNTYLNDRYYNYPLPFNQCKKCEFKTLDDYAIKKEIEEQDNNLKSGFKYCWQKQMHWAEEDFKESNAFEIWNLHHSKYTYLQEKKKLLLKDIEDDELKPKKPSNSIEKGMSANKRQLIQKEKSINKDYTPEVNKIELAQEIDSWKFPLNFIDFETSMVALPFYKGQKPYEQTAFQFSHHILHRDGFVEHATQYINLNPGEFPNFEFVSKLKEALEKNNGSIFMFSNHENTVLNQIHKQLEYSTFDTGMYNKNELQDFIEDITILREDKTILHKGKRCMIDMCDVIKRYYYNPYTKGSNSIKDVLPAIFKTSEFVINKYSQTIGKINMTSTNFKTDKVWIKKEFDKVIDPYKSLESPHIDYDNSFELIGEIEEINNGGAALTAYGRAQYVDMDEREREAIKSALLKYCELDTLAMVMIYEHLKELTK